MDGIRRVDNAIKTLLKDWQSCLRARPGDPIFHLLQEMRRLVPEDPMAVLEV
jgi:hypothetical protein